MLLVTLCKPCTKGAFLSHIKCSANNPTQSRSSAKIVCDSSLHALPRRYENPFAVLYVYKTHVLLQTCLQLNDNQCLRAGAAKLLCCNFAACSFTALAVHNCKQFKALMTGQRKQNGYTILEAPETSSQPLLRSTSKRDESLILLTCVIRIEHLTLRVARIHASGRPSGLPPNYVYSETAGKPHILHAPTATIFARSVAASTGASAGRIAEHLGIQTAHIFNTSHALRFILDPAIYVLPKRVGQQ